MSVFKDDVVCDLYRKKMTSSRKHHLKVRPSLLFIFYLSSIDWYPATNGYVNNHML